MSLTKVSYSMISGAVANILDYGADPTGATSSTSALNAAIASGNPVFVPNGTFLLTGESVVPSGMRIFGTGPSKSLFKCDVTAHTGVFLRVAGGNNIVEDVGFFGTSTAAGTAIYLSAVDVFEFTGWITLNNVYVNIINQGIRINNVFAVALNNCRVFSSAKGVLVDPQNDPNDNGYFTTLSFNKCYFSSNTDYGLKIAPPLISKNLVLRDTVIESNGGATSGYQSYIENINPLNIENCYFESTNTIPCLSLVNCNTFVYGVYVNGTGGFDLGTGSNSLVAFDFYGTAAQDKIVATGGALQSVELVNSQLGSATNITAARTHYTRTDIGATSYRNQIFGQGLQLAANSGVANTSYQEEVLLYKATVTAVVPANGSVNLLSDQALPNTWNADFAIGTAQIVSSYQPDIICQVTTATTGSAQLYGVTARNFSASPITLTNQKLNVMFVKGTAMSV